MTDSSIVPAGLPAIEPHRVLLVTGLSGAGKSTALKTLEDLGWEAIDNFPIRLLPLLMDTPQAVRRDGRSAHWRSASTRARAG